MTVVALSSPDAVRWVKDADQILVVDEHSGNVHRLFGLEAAVWSWLTLGYPYPRLVRLTAALLSLAPAEAEPHLARCLTDWQVAGLLESCHG